jgi:hypothetical protein
MGWVLDLLTLLGYTYPVFDNIEITQKLHAIHSPLLEARSARYHRNLFVETSILAVGRKAAYPADVVVNYITGR